MWGDKLGLGLCNSLGPVKTTFARSAYSRTHSLRPWVFDVNKLNTMHSSHYTLKP